MEPILELKELRCRFGSVRALDGLSLKIPPRSIAAFVGANGAGKTTTFSIIGGFLRRWRGEILVEGAPLRRFRSSGGMLGLLPQDMQFYEARTVRSQLRLFARLSGLGTGASRKECDRVLELVRLSDKARARADELSHGMRVRLGVAQALIATPPLVLLDEPTAGLDPQMLAEFRTIIDGVRGATTVMISSHDLSVLQSICDYVCIIDAGKLVYQGPMDELLARSSKVVFTVRGLGGKLSLLGGACPNCRVSLAREDVVEVEFDARQMTIAQVNAQVLEWCIRQGVEILAVESRGSLEERYLEKIGQLHSPPAGRKSSE